MVLVYIGKPISDKKLLKILKTSEYGTPSDNILFLENLGFDVTCTSSNMTELESLINQNYPVIVGVRTGELPYWKYDTPHAVLVVGYDDTQIYLNDPDRIEHPIAVSKDDFELAWLARYYYSAFIR